MKWQSIDPFGMEFRTNNNCQYFPMPFEFVADWIFEQRFYKAHYPAVNRKGINRVDQHAVETPAGITVWNFLHSENLIVYWDLVPVNSQQWLCSTFYKVLHLISLHYCNFTMFTERVVFRDFGNCSSYCRFCLDCGTCRLPDLVLVFVMVNKGFLIGNCWNTDVYHKFDWIVD